jgi:hypothetical protein
MPWRAWRAWHARHMQILHLYPNIPSTNWSLGADTSAAGGRMFLQDHFLQCPLFGENTQWTQYGAQDNAHLI